MFKRILLGLLFSLVLVGVTLGWVLQNPDRYRAELSDLLSQKSHWQIELGGPLSWDFNHGLALVAQDIELKKRSQPGANTPALSAHINRLSLRMSLGSLLGVTPALQIRSLSFETFDITRINSQIEVQELNWKTLHFSDVIDNNTAHVNGEFSLLIKSDSPLVLNGHLALNLLWQPDHLKLTDIVLQLPDSLISGQFNALQQNTVTRSASRNTDLVDWQWQGDFHADQLLYKGDAFQQVTLKTRNQNGLIDVQLASGDFFAGTAALDVTINVETEPWSWRLHPEMQQVQMQPLLSSLTKGKLQLEGLLDLSGDLQSKGNRLPELLRQTTGRVQFDGGTGQIDVSRLKQEALKLTDLLGGSNKVEGWPDTLAYQKLTGTWGIKGYHHELAANLDNLALGGTGTIHPLDDRLDMHLTLAFSRKSEPRSFEINPALADLPFPVDCKGRLSKPRCKIDRDGVLRLLGDSVRADSDSELRRDLERRIENEVPEELQGAARALLDSLGDLLGNDKP